MIGKIKGKLAEIANTRALIETASGLFYNVFVTPTVIGSHPVGSNLEVYTYLQVREDAHVLFGFFSKKELLLFELLLSVSGVGPKTAFSIVSSVKTEEFVAAVKGNTLDYFTSIPGLGKKTAMKIILELSQKMKGEFAMEKMYLSEEDKTVVEALVALGYKTHEARALLAKIPKDLPLEKRIQEALKFTESAKKKV